MRGRREGKGSKEGKRDSGMVAYSPIILSLSGLTQRQRFCHRDVWVRIAQVPLTAALNRNCS